MLELYMERKWCKGLVMEYTGLELNKMIAELEGINFSDYKECSNCYIYEELYSPIDDWDLLGPLMVKYKVGINHCEMFATNGDITSTKKHKSDAYFKSESEIPRAIIMCILKSKNII